jgi:flagellar L-ring protein FlgH
MVKWVMVVVLMLFGGVRASAQTTSIAKRQEASGSGQSAASAEDPRGLNAPKGNVVLERHSLIAVVVKPPRKFKPHDLITVIIREQRVFESDGELKSRKRLDLKSELNSIFKPIDGTLGAARFTNGMPNVDLKFNTRTTANSEKDREDRFTTRITGEIIDVKPNGNLVIQAKAETSFDNELSLVTLTGVVRSDDVTPDNTVLSTQMSNKVIDVKNSGAVRDGSRRGWMMKLVDLLGPF